MLKQFQKVHKMTEDEFADKIGIHKNTLRKIINEKSPKITFAVAYRIKEVTGLDPWDYIDDLEYLKKLSARKHTKVIN